MTGSADYGVARADTISNNYIYGPSELRVEQINGEKTLYLHHDQLGSTRLLTGSTGKTEATFTYDAYGNQIGHTGIMGTPLGYDGQYTSNDTGLIYLRARSYDPVTAQFMSVDPAIETTLMPYSYGKDDPLNVGDPSGLIPWGPKVKAAVANCQAWKSWHSKKSPFYGIQNVYYACLDLLKLPREVYGTADNGPTIPTIVKAGLGCAVGGPSASLLARNLVRAGVVEGGPATVSAYAVFCGGYAVGELIVDPVLHKLAPSVFAE